MFLHLNFVRLSLAMPMPKQALHWSLGFTRKFLVIDGLGFKLSERAPAVHLQHLFLFCDVAARQGADLRIHVLLKLFERKHGGTVLVRLLHLEEVREHIGEPSFQRCEPIEDVDLFHLRKMNMLRLIHDKCHVMQQLFALCLEIPLIEIIKCQEIPETDILKISPDRAVNPNPRQSDWVLREITEPCQCFSALNYVRVCLRSTIEASFIGSR